MVVRIVDVEARRVVRELGGFRGRVLDMVRIYIFEMKMLFRSF